MISPFQNCLLIEHAIIVILRTTSRFYATVTSRGRHSVLVTSQQFVCTCHITTGRHATVTSKIDLKMYCHFMYSSNARVTLRRVVR